ncbi:MAG: D-alanyl-D-alanine carboxypeptidase family protein [Clostridia bacterium]|nr:D-alanyl-D-alanine carboxypeptidase family protein [Clostridia bacterium]
MGNRATPPRSFNTIRQSQCKKRAKRETQRRIILLAICAVLILIFLAVSVLLVCSIVDAIGSSAPDHNDPSQNQPNEQQQPIRYQQITKDQLAVGYGPLILINNDHEYKFPSAAERSLAIISEHRPKDNGTNIYQITGPSTAKMQQEAITAFNEMMLKYYEIYSDGSINISSAYRSYKDQDQQFYSVAAGFSDHHSGYCIALDGVDSSHWIYENCKKYGFVLRYPDNKVNETGVSDYEECFRYVGVAHASYMTKNDLCLEEYVALLQKEYASENHLNILGVDGNQYEVYYVSVSEDDEVITFSVPTNYSYTVSGDNEGGFIVTVNLSDPLDE